MNNPTMNSSDVFYYKGYKNATRQLVVYVGVAVGGALYLLPWVFRDSSFLPFYLGFVGIMIYNNAYLHQMLRRTRLVVSPQGIEYHAVRFQLKSSWQDLGLSRKRSFLAFFFPTRLTTIQPIVKRNLWFDWDGDALRGNARYSIPMSPAIWDRYNELVELINQYRPDLFPERNQD